MSLEDHGCLAAGTASWLELYSSSKSLPEIKMLQNQFNHVELLNISKKRLKISELTVWNMPEQVHSPVSSGHSAIKIKLRGGGGEKERKVHKPRWTCI
jgi:hypothetical protein